MARDSTGFAHSLRSASGSGHTGSRWRPTERSRLHFLLFRRDSPKNITPGRSMADAPTAGAARYASVAEVRADVERAGGDASALCGFGRCETPYTRIAEHLHLAPSSGNSLEAWTSYTVKLFISTNGSRRPHFTAAAGSEPATSRSEKGYCAKNERAPREQHISLEHRC